jgi:hypothetical protein
MPGPQEELIRAQEATVTTEATRAAVVRVVVVSA